MDAETQAAIEQLAARLDAMVNDLSRQVRWSTNMHEREWQDAARWRTQWSAELDALIAEVNILNSVIQTLRSRLESAPDERPRKTTRRRSNKDNRGD